MLQQATLLLRMTSIGVKATKNIQTTACIGLRGAVQKPDIDAWGVSTSRAASHMAELIVVSVPVLTSSSGGPFAPIVNANLHDPLNDFLLQSIDHMGHNLRKLIQGDRCDFVACACQIGPSICVLTA